jgi:hypothetical protein
MGRRPGTTKAALLQPEPFDQFLEGLRVGAGDLEGGDRAPRPADLDRMRTFLRQRYAGAMPVSSSIDRHGQIYDLFRLDDQPASRAHRLTPAAAPPAGFLGVGKVGLQFGPVTPDAKAAGLVPIRRLSLADVARSQTLDRFLHKRGARRRSRLRAAEPLAPGSLDATHRWADAYQAMANSGAVSTLNIWQPQLADGQTFSLSQIWCVALGPQGRQTAEIGWHVYPDISGHDQPAMFCYWTCDGYANSGSYNGAAGDFHFNGSNTVLGVPITDISVSDGAQKEVLCAVKLYEGNWWIYVGGDQPDNAVGYFPGSLYGSGPLASGAAEADFGGEVCGGPPFAPMGSGAFAADGYGKAAYQRNLGICAANASLVSSLDLDTDEASPADYTVSTGSSNDWGSYMYFGGPG